MITGGSGSGKTNILLNLINEQNNIDKIYLNARDLNEPKYKILIKKRKYVGIKHLNDPNAFIECSFIRWMMFMRIFMIIIQAEKEKS